MFKSTTIFVLLLSVSPPLFSSLPTYNWDHCPCLVPTRCVIVRLMVMIIAFTDFPIISCWNAPIVIWYQHRNRKLMCVCVCVCVYIYIYGCVCVCVSERERTKMVSGESMFWPDLLCTFPCCCALSSHVVYVHSVRIIAWAKSRWEQLSYRHSSCYSYIYILYISFLSKRKTAVVVASFSSIASHYWKMMRHLLLDIRFWRWPPGGYPDVFTFRELSL